MPRITKGKYFHKILLSFTILVMLGVMGASLSVYLSIGDSVQRMQYEHSQKLHEQIVYTFDLVNTNASNIVMYLYYANDDVRSLMFRQDVETDIASSIVAMNRVRRTLLSVNPGIHSVYVFNAHTLRFYSSFSGFLFQDQSLLDLLDGFYGDFPIQIPLYRYMQDGFPVFTYLMYDRMRDGHMNGGVALNMDARVFLDALWQDGTMSKGETLFLITEDGLLIDQGENVRAHTLALVSAIPDLFGYGRVNANGFLITRVGSSRYFVSYAFLENFNMLLVSAQPYTVLDRQVVALRNTIITVTLIFLAVMLIAAMMVSRVVYKPVDTLVQHTGGLGYKPKDEISFLNELYSRNRAMLEKYETELDSYERAMRDSWFKKLLTGDVEEPELDIITRINEYGFTQAERFIVSVLRLSSLEKSVWINNHRLIKFAILNVSMEIFSRGFENYGVDFKDDLVVVVISVPPEKTSFMEEIAALSQESMAYIAKHFEVPVTASLSGLAENAEQIASAYNDAVSNSDYRFVLGVDSVITPESVADNVANDSINFTFKSEKAVAESLRLMDREGVIAAVDAAIKSISLLKFPNIVISIIHLTHTIMETVSDTIKTSKRIETEQNLSDLLRALSSIETASEYKERLIASLEPFLSHKRENTKYADTTQLIEEYVKKHLKDPNLCLKQIADVVRLSTKHANYIFKSETGVSVPDYINKERMELAVYMLKSTSMSIKEIAVAVGIVNQTYFYSKFKKHYGMSPKAYQLDFLMRQSGSDTDLESV